MKKHVFNVSEFREAWREIVTSHCDENGGTEALCDRYALIKLESISDDEMADSEIYSDLGLDSLDVMEITGILLARYDAFADDIEFIADNCFNQTVNEFLEVLTEHQVQV